MNLTATVTPVETVDELVVHLESFKVRGKIVKKEAAAFLKKQYGVCVIKLGRKCTNSEVEISIVALTLKLKSLRPTRRNKSST